jgi:EmrB/QacA subfamily drug resistance transporter
MEHTENRTRRSAVLLVTTVVSFLTPFMSSGLNIALPAIGKEFNLNVILLSWVVTSFMLTSASLLIPFGRLADILGRKKVFTLGIVIFTFGSILCAVSVSGTMLLISRGIQGIGGSATFATCIAILTSEFPIEERGKVLGINTAVVYLGLSLGPSLGGLLTQYAGWKSIFIICSAVSLLVIIATFWKLKGVATEVVKEKFDYFGSVLYSLTLVFTMLGVTLLSKNKTSAIWLIISGIAIGLLFFWWENRTQKPLVNLTLFKQNRGFTFSNLAALVNYSGTWAVSFLLSLYLQYGKGFDAKTAGLIMIASPAIQAIFSPIAGRLSDRIEPRILASTGMAISALGIGLLAFINQNTSIGYIITCLIILGFGFALFSSPNTNAVMSSINRQDYGVDSAMLGTMRQVGMMLSMGITTVVFNLVIGQVEITPENSPALITSAHIIFLISTVLCISAIFASLARGNIRENDLRNSIGSHKS